MLKTCALAFAAVVALIVFAGTGSAQSGPAVDEVAVDVDVSGNESNSLGQTQFCNTAPLAVGDTIDVDVVLRGLPADPRFFGFSLNLLFDPAVLQIDDVHTDEEPSLMAGQLLLQAVDYKGDQDDNSAPGNTGNVRVDWVQTVFHTPSESGDGVLVRVTITAVGAGTSPLSIRGFEPGEGFVAPPEIQWVDGGPDPAMLYQVRSVKDGVVVVGSGACPGDAPTPVPTPVRPPSPTPIGQTPSPPVFTSAPTPTLSAASSASASATPRRSTATTRSSPSRTATPSTGADVDSDDGGSWLWPWGVLVVLLLVLLAAAAAGWFAVTRARRSS